MKETYTRPAIEEVLLSAIRSVCTLPASARNTQIEPLKEDEFEW